MTLRRIRQNRGSSAVTEKARANEHTRIIVEIKRRAANFDANRKHALASVGCQKSLSAPEVGQRGAATLSDEIKRQNVRPQL
jgi:hypothetical protein